jgi:hypothetical protein
MSAIVGRRLVERHERAGIVVIKRRSPAAVDRNDLRITRTTTPNLQMVN